MPETMKKILELRFRISSQLYLGLGGAVLLTLAASLVGWFSFDQVGDAQTRVNDGTVPELAAAFDVAQFSSALVADAASLPTATTLAEVSVVNERIEVSYAAFDERLTELETRAGEREQERFDRIRAYSDTLLLNIQVIKDDLSEKFFLQNDSAGIQAELTELGDRLDDIVAPARDDQLFYTVTGYREIDQPPAGEVQHRAEDELTRFHYLSELQGNANTATQLLATAPTLSDPSLMEPLRERFESSVFHIDRNLQRLAGSEVQQEVEPLFAGLVELGTGEPNAFDVQARILELENRQQTVLSNNYEIAALLLNEMDYMVHAAREKADTAAAASEQAIFTGRLLLLIITLVSAAGAALIAWLFVGRVLLHRLALLSDWMRRMAGGDLEARAEISGRDEVADMAAALEVFRRSSLEAQRLNLVEQLAEELQGKNDELERTNDQLELTNDQLELTNENLEQAMSDLNTAQDQIVMREKLAALGELTAGVAHEIRNPLNFVKNFSEASEELLEEMKETLEEHEDGALNEEQRDLLEDIFNDLTENLERIRTHGDRANRIVHDMLMMSRESVGHQPTNINHLLDEHARLAYHSARAVDSDFQLDLQYDLDESIEEIDVNPQEVGRVFLNVVNNGCYATNEKRVTLASEAPGTEYMPALLLSTRLHDEQIQVRIRDNGTGMPPEVIEKMFNPFYTTKPTNKGTGLGLSICNDIVRRHGGEIAVESQEGEFTELTITLPLHPPIAPDEAEDELEYDDDREYAAEPAD